MNTTETELASGAPTAQDRAEILRAIRNHMAAEGRHRDLHYDPSRGSWDCGRNCGLIPEPVAKRLPAEVAQVWRSLDDATKSDLTELVAHGRAPVIERAKFAVWRLRDILAAPECAVEHRSAREELPRMEARLGRVLELADHYGIGATGEGCETVMVSPLTGERLVL